MANGIRTGDPRGFNKGSSSKSPCRFSEFDKLLKETYRPKRYGNNNKDEYNSPKTLNDKNHQASYKKNSENGWNGIKMDKIRENKYGIFVIQCKPNCLMKLVSKMDERRRNKHWIFETQCKAQSSDKTCDWNGRKKKE